MTRFRRKGWPHGDFRPSPAVVRGSHAGSLDHPGRGLGRLDLRRLRGPALHDLQDAHAGRAHRGFISGHRPPGERRVCGLPAGWCGRRPLLRRPGRSLRSSSHHGRDDPGLLDLLRADGLRADDLASPCPPIPRGPRHGRRVGGGRGPGRRDLPSSDAGGGLGALPCLQRDRRWPGLADRHPLRPAGVVACGLPRRALAVAAGPLDPTWSPRTHEARRIGARDRR